MEKVVTSPGAAEPKEAAKQKIFSLGTYSGNPISMIAGLAMIKELEKSGFYERINGYGERLRIGLTRIAGGLGLSVQVLGVGSMFSLHFANHPIKNLRDILNSDRETTGAFYLGLTANGVHIPEYHVAFTSGAHTETDIKKILDVAEKVLTEIKKAQNLS